MWPQKRNLPEIEMSLTVEDTVAETPPTPKPERRGQIRVDGKFFRIGNGAKHFIKGVTYGPFAPGSHDDQFPETTMIEARLRADGDRRDQHRAGLHRAAAAAA